MHTTHNTPRRPQRMACLLLAAAVALLLGTQLFVQFGWPRDQFALEMETGESAALDGFTVQGSRFGSGDTGLTFAVENGALTTQRSRVPVPDEQPYSFSGSWELTVPAEDYPAVDAAAEATPTSATYGLFGLSRTWSGTNYLSEANTLAVTATIQVGSNTGRTGTVRLNLGTLYCTQPVPVLASRFEKGAPAQLSAGYKVGSSDLPEDVTAVPADWSERSGVDILWAGSQSVLFVEPLAIGTDLVRGIYRITEALSDADCAALPPDAAIDGKPVRSAATPCGAVELICALEEDEVPFSQIEDCGTAHALLTMNNAGDIRLRLFDESWQLTDDRILATEPPLGRYGRATSDYAFYPLTGLREGEVAFLLYPTADEAAADAWTRLFVVRVADGKVAAQGMLTASELPERVPAPLAAGLRADDAALMTVTRAQHTERSGLYQALQQTPTIRANRFQLPDETDPATGTVTDGLRLTVYEDGAPAAAALLRSREQASWRGQFAYYIADGSEGRLDVRTAPQDG